MNTKSEIHFICEDNFETTILNEKKPVLLMCMPRDDQFSQQINVVMETLAKHEGCLKVGLLDESFIGPFKKRYRVLGTPTFLILQQGKEQSRSLGLADEKILKALIAGAAMAPEQIV